MGQTMLPEIPRTVTALAEWLSCIIYLLPLQKRFEKKYTVMILAFAGGMQVALQSFVSDFDINYWLLGMFLNVLFMFAYIWLIGKIHFKEAVYWCAISFVTAEFLASLEWQISCIIFNYRTSYDNWLLLLVMLFVFTVVLGTIYFFEKKIKGISRIMSWNQVIITVILAIIAFTMSNVSFLNSQWNSSVIQQWSVYYIRTLVEFCVMIIFYLQQRVIKEHDYRNEIASINNVLNLQYKQYLDFKESSEYISRQCHDLKHQIAELRGACSDEEREEYLHQMEEAINQYNGQNVTGNVVLDALLTRKKIYCLQHRIDFSIAADGRAMSSIAVRDICTIMGNILDNAIEHVSSFEKEEERQIQGEVYQKNSFLMIRLENYYHGNEQEEGILPKTTKHDKQRHGYGLKSVKYTVEKYGGTMTLRTEGNWFVIRILIPISNAESDNDKL